MILDPTKTYIEWNGSSFPNSFPGAFPAPAGSTIDWGDGTSSHFDTSGRASHHYTDGKTQHTIVISDLTSIGNDAFYGSSNSMSITIGNSVTSIGNNAFGDCIGLTSITIPDGVTSIGSEAFIHCESLANIYYKGTEEQWNAITKGSNWNSSMGSNVEGGTVITYNYTG